MPRPTLLKIWRAIQVVFHWLPLSLLGWLAAPLAVWLLVQYGWERHDKILQFVCFFGLALMAILAAAALGVGLWLKLRKEHDLDQPLDLYAGTPFQTGYAVPRLGWMPLLRIDIVWRKPPGAVATLNLHQGDLREEILSPRRAWLDQIDRHVTVGDVFGLTRVRFVRRSETKVRIAPDCKDAAPLRPLTQYQSGDLIAHPAGKPEGDLVEMRNYAPGDPLKRVLWKTYARTGKLMVRMPEKAVSPCDRLLACLIAAEGDEAAAGVARALLENGSLGGDFLFCADGEPEPTSETGEALHQVMRSSNARGQAGTGLESLLSQASLDVAQACILFVPWRPGPWLDPVATRVAAAPGRYHALVGVDQLTPAPHWTRRWIFRRENPDISQVIPTLEVCQRLAQAGAEVQIVDREFGRMYPWESFHGFTALNRRDRYGNLL